MRLYCTRVVLLSALMDLAFSVASALAPPMWTTDEIAQLCYAHYVRLPKQGKPEPNREWTLLAAVVKVQSPANQACDTPDKEVQGEPLFSLSATTELTGWDANYVRCYPHFVHQVA